MARSAMMRRPYRPRNTDLAREMTAGDGRVAAAVVGDGQAGLPGLVRRFSQAWAGAGVADHVPQALLGDLEQGVLDLGGELR